MSASDWFLSMLPLLGVLLARSVQQQPGQQPLLLRATDSDAAFHLLVAYGRLKHDHTRPLLRLGLGLAARPIALLGHACVPAVSASQIMQGSRLHLIRARGPHPMGANRRVHEKRRHPVCALTVDARSWRDEPEAWLLALAPVLDFMHKAEP